MKERESFATHEHKQKRLGNKWENGDKVHKKGKLIC